MILLIDNFDNFAHNLARYFVRLGQRVRVVRNDAINVNDVHRLNPTALVLSPGPCTPAEAGRSLEIVRDAWTRYPVLGVCLGHQTIVSALGGAIVGAPHPMHGRTSDIRHDGRGVFRDLPCPLRVGRYHSLIADRSSLPVDLEVTAATDDGIVMAVRHRQRPVVGLQFHPESILTEHGYAMLASFLRLAGGSVPAAVPSRQNELSCAQGGHVPLPETPLTF